MLDKKQTHVIFWYYRGQNLTNSKTYQFHFIIRQLRDGDDSEINSPGILIAKEFIGLLIFPNHQYLSVQFSRSVVSDSLQPHELQHARPPRPSPTPRVHSNSGPSSWWCHPAISSPVVPFSSCPQSLPASVFSNESTLTCPILPWKHLTLTSHTFKLKTALSN